MKELLIVVDYQVDFVNGSLGFKGAELLEEGIVNKIREARKKKTEVCFTFDTHYENYLETNEGKKLPIKHCLKGSEGFELYGKVKEQLKESDVVFYKETFGSLALANYLQKGQYTKIEIVGLVTNICILSNAILAKSALPEAEIIVIKSLVGTFDKKLEEETFDLLKSVHIEISE
ncbi:MAG: cysteine hydrolase [Bacillales bacterium]|jgi:nicotinamidase-related amidase|nr:cysteine hydrolase [Bacillales bacterium]